jgi:murein DD-endopeptidase MepM/ murein hydrolase activator NlpD
MKPKIALPFHGAYPITFRFGEAPDWYVKVAGYPHNGVDFGLPVGVAVLACDEGVVSYADNTPDGNGLGVNLSHSWGLSQYWHLSKLAANFGDKVKRGDVIGYSGDTGFATGPHLHFGVKVSGYEVAGMRGWVDPLKFLENGPGTPAEPPAVNRYYFVRPGDSLWKIAAKFYGQGYHWRRIYEANRDKIQNPNLIYPFQKLLIP